MDLRHISKEKRVGALEVRQMMHEITFALIFKSEKPVEINVNLLTFS